MRQFPLLQNYNEFFILVSNSKTKPNKKQHSIYGIRFKKKSPKMFYRGRKFDLHTIKYFNCTLQLICKYKHGESVFFVALF